MLNAFSMPQQSHYIMKNTLEIWKEYQKFSLS